MKYFLSACCLVLLLSCQDQEKGMLPMNPGYDADLAPFYHGIASGDPLQDRVIIWTKVTPAHHHAVNVVWRVSDRADMSNTLYDGQLLVDSTNNYTVKVDVTDLLPGTEYYYQFDALGASSPIGHTQTLPEEGMDSLSLAVVSCSNYEWGYFNAYRHLAERDVDMVLHLGDYIYEYEPGGYGDTTIGRIHEPPHEIITLEDYRTRYSQYRLDPDLQAVHQAHPMICIWDDHEVSNNVYTDGAQNHQEDEGDFYKRRDMAKQVYYEWIPIREHDGHHYRSFRYGDLANVIMLDERLEGRTEPAATYEEISDDQKMLGAEQLSWLKKELTTDAKWNVIGNQVIFADLDVSAVYTNSKVNLDAWDGYPSEKAEILDFFAKQELDQNIFLTGDTHSSWAFDIDDESGEQRAWEFGTTSITSANYSEYTSMDTVSIAESAFIQANQHINYINLSDHGYAVLRLGASGGSMTWYYVDNLRTPQSAEREAKVIKFEK